MTIFKITSMIKSPSGSTASNNNLGDNRIHCSTEVPDGVEEHNNGITQCRAQQWTQILALLPVYLLQVCYGMNSGYPAILTPQLAEEGSEFQITPDQESWIVSIDNLATPLVCVLSGFLQQRFGPLRVLMFACFPYSLGWLFASVATTVNFLYVSRLLVGISHALLTTTVYTVEVASRHMRGTYSLLESVLRCAGCLLIYSLGFAFRWHSIAVFAPLVPLLAFATAVFCAPESPVFLLTKHRTSEAHLALIRLYGPGYRVTEEVSIIRDNLDRLKQRRGRASKLAYALQVRDHPEIYKPFLIIVALSIIQQFSGMSILRAYVVKIFNQVFKHDRSTTTNVSESALNWTRHDDLETKSTTSNEAYISAIVIGSVRLIASLLLSKLLRRFRRRSMYFTSAILTIISLASFATCNLFIEGSEMFRWAALFTACLLVFSVQLGIQTLPILLSGELFPSDIRAFGKGLTRSATCCLLVIGLKLYPVLEQGLDVSGTFYLFSGVLLICLPLVYWILPETKDMGLEMIHTYFTPPQTIFYVDLMDRDKLDNEPDGQALIASQTS